MKLQAKRNWLKSDNVKPGDTITILNEGEIVTSAKFTYPDGTPRKDFIIKVTHNGAEADMNINATNKKTLIAAYGDETTAWIGKVCKLDVANVMIGGNTKKSIILQAAGDVKNVNYEA